jgi:hypothetical protein
MTPLSRADKVLAESSRDPLRKNIQQRNRQSLPAAQNVIDETEFESQEVRFAHRRRAHPRITARFSALKTHGAGKTFVYVR